MLWRLLTFNIFTLLCTGSGTVLSPQKMPVMSSSGWLAQLGWLEWQPRVTGLTSLLPLPPPLEKETTARKTKLFEGTTHQIC